MISRARILAIACAAAGLFSLSALAQPAPGSNKPKEEMVRPPTPTSQDKPPVIRNFITAIVIVGAVVGVALIPSKRGHQD